MLLAIALGGCAVRQPSTNDPSYLGSQIREHPPASNNITVYPTNGPHGGKISCLAHSSSGDSVIAGTDAGDILRSTDGGNTWTQASIPYNSGRIFDIIAFGGQMLAGSDTGFFDSRDDGVSWHTKAKATDRLPRTSKYLLLKDRLLVATSDGIFQVNDRWDTKLLEPKITYAADPGNFAWEDLRGTDFLVATGAFVLASDGYHVLRSRDLIGWEKADKGLGLMPPNGSRSTVLLKELAGVGSELFAVTEPDDLTQPNFYRSNDGGASWQKTTELGDTRVAGVFGVDDSLFVDTGNILLRRNSAGQWQDLGYPSHNVRVTDLILLGDAVVMSTDEGIYTRGRDKGSWKECDTGIIRGRSPGRVLSIDGRDFVLLDEKLYRTSDAGQKWRLMSDAFEREPTSRPTPIVVNDIAGLGNLLFVATDDGLYRGPVEGERLERVQTLPDVNETNATKRHVLSPLLPPVTENGPYRNRRVVRLSTDGNRLVAMVKNRIFSSSDLGESWEIVNDKNREEKFPYDEPVLEFADNTLLTWYRTSLIPYASSCYRLLKNSSKWEEINEGLGHNPITAFASFGDVVYAGSSGPATALDRETKFSPELFRLNHAATSTRWERLQADGLSGEVRVLWIDSTHPAVIIAGTTDGLFWSNDDGQSFTNVNSLPEGRSFRQVGGITFRQGHLFMSTDNGFFYLSDQIPRGKWYEWWLHLIEGYPRWFSIPVVAIVLMLVLSTRLSSLLLKLDLWGLRQIAPLFYLLPFGRWKLYRRYNKNVRDNEGLTDDLKYGVEHYVDLPFEVDRQTAEGRTLSQYFTLIPLNCRFLINGDGGRGKSTLCHHLARRCVEGRDVFVRKFLEPVVVDGLLYKGDLLSAIASALQESGAYVNEAIVESQMTAGNLLVIVDGFSEIRETYVDADSLRDLAQFIQRHPDTQFIFTSRSNLPPVLHRALKATTTVTLQDVDESTERSFLAQHLKHGTREVDCLMSEIRVRFDDLPRTPLMLKLVARVYDKTARVPKNATSLFAEYTDQILRPEATDIEYPSGIHYAIRHLVRETYLRSGGDHGLTEEQGVELLKRIKDELEAREISHSPIRLLHVLIRAGLYKQIGENLSFFHDSFESYFAARALESDFRAKRYELLGECLVNDRLLETRKFLREILDETGDGQKFDTLVTQAEGHWASRA